ncbi:MAG: hypothetical protein K1X54_10320 [Flavobacteriales bacterium]|nr:hypothetical protein [Flavobacteriales bacterium]
MVAFVVATTIYLSYTGYDYYGTPLEERFYHPRHAWFKPSGVYGHGIGILGTLLIIIGVWLYIARKRYNFMSKYLRIKYLLEFHIFLCTLGPILILFHTAFKFGGIVSVAFWSMVAVVASGVIGRFIYIQIPHTIEGRALSMNEVKDMRNKLIDDLRNTSGLDETVIQHLLQATGNAPDTSSGTTAKMSESEVIREVKKALSQKQVDKAQRKSIMKMVREEFALARRIGRLELMQRLFKYWHVAHLPFALIMLIILIVHVAVTLSFGYRWIF